MDLTVSVPTTRLCLTATGAADNGKQTGLTSYHFLILLLLPKIPCEEVQSEWKGSP